MRKKNTLYVDTNIQINSNTRPSSIDAPDYKAIFNTHHLIWKEKITELVNDKDFALQMYTEGLNREAKNAPYIQILKGKQINLDMMKMIFALHEVQSHKGKSDLTNIVYLIKLMALHFIKQKYLVEPLAAYGITVGDINIATFPDGSTISFNLPAAKLSGTQRHVCLFSPTLNDKANKKFLAEWLERSIKMGLPVNTIDNKEIPSKLIQKLYKELYSIIEVNCFSCNNELRFLDCMEAAVPNTALIIFMSMYCTITNKWAGNKKTLEDFERDFLKIIHSDAFKLYMRKSPIFFYKKVHENNILQYDINNRMEDYEEVIGLNETIKIIIHFPKIIQQTNRFILLYLIKPEQFLKDNEESNREMEKLNEENKKALDYLEKLSIETNQKATLTNGKKNNINENKASDEESYLNKAKISTPSSLNEASVMEGAKAVNKYLKEIVESSDIITTVSQYIKDIKNGMEICGRKENIVALSRDNMMVVTDLRAKKPIIYVFNKSKMGVTDSYIARLATTSIDYYGYGSAGNKIEINEQGDITECHIKYYEKDGTSQRLPATYYDNNMTIENIQCAVLYFDLKLSALEWHQSPNFAVPLHETIPAELKTALSTTKERSAASSLDNNISYLNRR